MKDRLTITLDRKRALKLRRVSDRRGTTVSEVVAALVDQLDADKPLGGELFSKRFAGILAGTLSTEDAERGDEVGKQLRRTKAYARLKDGQRKRRA